MDKDREIQKLTQDNLELDKRLKEAEAQFYKQQQEQHDQKEVIKNLSKQNERTLEDLLNRL